MTNTNPDLTVVGIHSGGRFAIGFINCGHVFSMEGEGQEMHDQRNPGCIVDVWIERCPPAVGTVRARPEVKS